MTVWTLPHVSASPHRAAEESMRSGVVLVSYADDFDGAWLTESWGVMADSVVDATVLFCFCAAAIVSTPSETTRRGATSRRRRTGRRKASLQTMSVSDGLRPLNWEGDLQALREDFKGGRKCFHVLRANDRGFAP